MFILSPQEIVRLLFKVRIPRYRLMIALAYATGMKLKEIVSLKIENIDSEKGLIHVNGRDLPLPRKIKTDLWRLTQGRPPRQHVFLNKNNKPLKEVDAQGILRTASKKFSISKRVTFTVLRHTFAVHLLQLGVDIKWVQKLLGHKALRTTRRCYKKVLRDLKPDIKSPMDVYDIPKISGFLLYSNQHDHR